MSLRNGVAVMLLACLLMGNRKASPIKTKGPNILFCVADDWGWPHAAGYGDSVVKTPTFNRLAAEGILFEKAFVSSPSCTPSRGAILTGQDFWRLEQGANLWSTLDKKFPVYPLLLEKAGYFVGFWGKAWGPGDLAPGGYIDQYPSGNNYKDGLKEFMDAKPDGQPFCFWLGSKDPHRDYEKGSGAAAGIDVNAIKVPVFYPNEKEIQSDIADYYYEVQRFDNTVNEAIKLLESRGELENTIIVVTGDNGMPFPRCKANVYDMGVRVPLVIWWGDRLKKASVNRNLVSLTDLAPTFLDLAGVPIPAQMTGRSLKPLLTQSSESKQNVRDFIVYGKERHTPAQLKPSTNGYPSRAISSDDYVYILNLFPERWPAGVPAGATHSMNSFTDCDDGPTKRFLIKNQMNYQKFYDLSFAKRPKEELYNIKSDPDQLVNLAQNAKFAEIKAKLSKKLTGYLKSGKDPRFVPPGFDFDAVKYRNKL